MQPKDSYQFVIGRNVFSESELQINQREAIKDMKEILNGILLRLRAGTSSKDWTARWYEQADRPTQVCSIFGDRGEGKTATLVSLCAMLAQESPSPYLVAPLLEPELLDPEEELFPAIAYTLLATLWQVQERLDEEGPGFRELKLEKELTFLVEQFLSRSERGRKIIAESSVDLETYANRIARRSTSLLTGRPLLMKWIDDLLDQCEKEILIFPIDDVDVCREHSENILEAVRMYLSHPRVVVILTADLETIRRAIRNRLLSQLPQVFTGGESSLPEKEGQKSEGRAFIFGGRARAQLLAQEYLADDEYAQQFLYKICPPAYRVYLAGLPASRRQVAKFSVDESPAVSTKKGLSHDISLEEIWMSIPLVVDLVEAFDDEHHPCRGETITETASEFLGMDSYDTYLSEVFSWYPETFSPTLRILINQVNYFSTLAKTWRENIRRLSNDKLVENEPPNIHEPSRDMTWTDSVFDPRDLSDSDREFLTKAKSNEERMMMRLLQGLSFHPGIEADQELFFCNRHQAYAFQAGSISDFYALTTNLGNRGSGTFGFVFSYSSRDGSRIPLSDSSSSLVNVIMEYASLRNGSIWPVLKAWGRSISLNEAVDLKRTGVLRLVWSLQTDNHTEVRSARHLSKLVLENLSTCIDLRESIRTEDAYMTHFMPSDLGPPCMLRTIREASIYFHNGLHSSVSQAIRRFVSHVNDQYERTYLIKDKDRKEKDRVPAPSLESVVTQERYTAYRILGIIAFRVWQELDGLYKALTFPNPEKLLQMTVRDDCHWLINDTESVGPLLCSVLRDTRLDSLEDRFLVLLYLASLPLGSLLTAWKQSNLPDENAGAVLSCAIEILKEMENRFGANSEATTGKPNVLRIDITNLSESDDFAEEDQPIKWKKVDPAKPAVRIKGIASADAPEFIVSVSREAPSCDLDAQADRLNNVMELLIELQNYPNEAREVHYASATQAPKAWEELLEHLEFENTVQGILSSMQHLDFSQEPDEDESEIANR